MLIPDIMDIEASGFGAETYPIEVGFCLSSGERFCSLIKPDASWSHWDYNAEQVHGITREQLETHGQSAQLVCYELNDLLTGKTLYTDAWVADKAWLNKLYHLVGIEPSFQLSAIENIQTERQHLIWDRVREQLIEEAEFSRHRASVDAYFIQQLYLRTRDICETGHWQEYMSGNRASR